MDSLDTCTEDACDKDPWNERTELESDDSYNSEDGEDCQPAVDGVNEQDDNIGRVITSTSVATDNVTSDGQREMVPGIKLGRGAKGQE